MENGSHNGRARRQPAAMTIAAPDPPTYTPVCGWRSGGRRGSMSLK